MYVCVYIDIQRRGIIINCTLFEEYFKDFTH